MAFDLTPLLRPFQLTFIREALRPEIDTAVFSAPRGQGKSSLAAHLARRSLTPGDSLFESGCENHIVAASVGQARKTVFRLLREMIGEPGDQDEYAVNESTNLAEIKHKATNTRVSVMAPSWQDRSGSGAGISRDL